MFGINAEICFQIDSKESAIWNRPIIRSQASKGKSRFSLISRLALASRAENC
jgi:hypothetical protein